MVEQAKQGLPHGEADPFLAELPDSIGRYPVQRFLTASRFSTLYLAADPQLGRDVVIKLFAVDENSPEPPFSHGEWRRRFIREGQIMGRLDHPNLLNIHESGVSRQGQPFHVLPFMRCNLPSLIGFDADEEEAATMGERERPKSLDPGQVMIVMAQILSALDYLHGKGIVHRDLKASNILLNSRQDMGVRICDFGMAKVGDRLDMQPGAWIGTPGYMSPEQQDNAASVTGKADVYSAGMLAWRMLTGHLPVGVPENLNAPMPEPLAQVVMAAVQADPDQRPGAGELLAMLRKKPAMAHIRVCNG